LTGPDNGIVYRALHCRASVLGVIRKTLIDLP
jgi:hypothetical protein